MSTVSQSTLPDSGLNGSVCIANISTAERRKRLMSGVVMFVISLVILGVLMATGVSRWWRLPLFLLFAGASTGYFQWHDKTCVGLAARQSRKLGDSVEKIEDSGELAQIKRQANKVQMKTLVAAACLTVIALALPLL